MNPQLEILIRELAEKLGTTGVHLWGVMLHQATITGTIELMVMTTMALLAVFGYKFIKTKTTPKTNEFNAFKEPDWDSDLSVFVWAGWLIYAIMSGLVIGTSLSSTISALVNPEYWALMQLLSRL